MRKEKDIGRVWRNPCASLCSCPPMKSHRAHSSPTKENAATCVCFCPGKPTRASAPRDFIGDNHASTLLTIYQNSRLPKRKQVFSINQVICINSRHSKPPFDLENGSSAEFPNSRQRPP